MTSSAIAAIAIVGASAFHGAQPAGPVFAAAAGEPPVAAVSLIWQGAGSPEAAAGSRGALVQMAQAQPAKPATPAKPVVATPAAAAVPTAVAPTNPPQLSQSDFQVVVTLLRSTLSALSQADITGNYTVLRDLGAASFRDKNTAAALAEIFAPIRMSGVDLSAAVFLDPHLTLAQLNSQGMLDIAGSLATQPVPVNFEILYQGASNTWQLFGLSISAATPTAPPPGLVPPVTSAAPAPATVSAPTGAPATATPIAKPPVPVTRP